MAPEPGFARPPVTETEQLEYNLLFRWFVGLSSDDPIWDATVFTTNRERLQQGDVFQKFMVKLLEQEEVKPLLSRQTGARPSSATWAMR